MSHVKHPDQPWFVTLAEGFARERYQPPLALHPTRHVLVAAETWWDGTVSGLPERREAH